MEASQSTNTITAALKDEFVSYFLKSIENSLEIN